MTVFNSESMDISPRSIKNPRHEPNAAMISLSDVLNQDQDIGRLSLCLVGIDVGMVV